MIITSRKPLRLHEVYCWNKGHRCRLKDPILHLEICKKERILDGCNARLMMCRKLPDHLRTKCQFHKKICECCWEEFLMQDLGSNQEECKTNLIDCPNRCHASKFIQKILHKYWQSRPIIYGCKNATYLIMVAIMTYRTKSSRHAANHPLLTIQWFEEIELKVDETLHLIKVSKIL